MKKTLSLWTITIASLALGCEPETRADSAAADALARCDVREAQRLYDEQWRARPDDGAAALGLALTDMMLLGEDPHAEAGLARFGFTDGIDSEMLLWGPNALLDSLVRHRPSEEYADHVERRFPYALVRETGNGFDLIAPETNARDIVAEAWAMQPRFERLVDAFTLAAETGPQTIRIDGSCGVGEIELQAPELYLLAATYQGIVLALQISRGYDWSFPVRDVLDDRDSSVARLEARVALLNEHLGAISDATALRPVSAQWDRFFALMDRALVTADEAGAPGPDAVVEWRAYRDGLLASMREQGQAASALATREVTAPGLTPVWSGELAPFFAGTLDLSSFGRTFRVYEDPTWGDAWIEVDEAPIDALLMEVLSRSPFDDDLGEVDWAHADAWSGDRTDWRVTEVDSTRPGVGPVEAPRFITPVIERYLDTWYFESR